MSERTPLYDAAARAGAVFVETSGWLMPAHYEGVAAEYASAREQAALFDLSHRGKVEVVGPDATRFLHNLSTNDIRNLAPGAGCEAFLTTAKARVVAPVLIYRVPPGKDGDSFWLDTDPGLGGKVLEHLDYYHISEQVELADRSAEFAQLHLVGPQARSVLATALQGELPELAELQHLARPLQDVLVYIRRHSPLAASGYDLVCPCDRAETVWQRLLDAGARPAGLEAYDVLRVEGGIPVWGKEIDEQRFVVEVGRAAQAICYTKGCYLGQEPIVMARDRGHVNRTLLGLKVEGEGEVTAGSRVLHGAEEVGQVTSSVVSPRSGTLALAYLRRGHQEPGGTLEVEAKAGPRRAEVTSLPFDGAGGSSVKR